MKSKSNIRPEQYIDDHVLAPELHRCSFMKVNLSMTLLARPLLGHVADN